MPSSSSVQPSIPKRSFEAVRPTWRGSWREAINLGRASRRSGLAIGRRAGEGISMEFAAALKGHYTPLHYAKVPQGIRSHAYPWLDALVMMFSLMLIAQVFDVPFNTQYGMLMLLSGILYLSVFSIIDAVLPPLNSRSQDRFGRRVSCWLMTFAALLFIGYAFKSSADFSRRVLLLWFIVTPISMGFASYAIKRLIASGRIIERRTRRAVIVGFNPTAQQLVQEMTDDSHLSIDVLGYFDDRTATRLHFAESKPLLGSLCELHEWVKQHKVDLVYITLPAFQHERIVAVRNALRDTTASVYFVPHIGGFDPIQARLDHVNGIPVIAVCESPIYGINAVLKRSVDVLVSLLALLSLAPLLLIVALAVKLGSPGPIIFKQRRYGLDGSEIVVYKFRTMTVCEDGDLVKQASKNDKRVTPLGAFLRRTSIDELPQFVNVLQGRMSIVGPRPHAVAHNELYRKLIDGYMLRHKVKPGITGWAQVNGFRGETQTLEKMKGRVDYDLDYMRRWSVALDLYIIIRTALLVVKDQQAY